MYVSTVRTIALSALLFGVVLVLLWFVAEARAQTTTPGPLDPVFIAQIEGAANSPRGAVRSIDVIRNSGGRVSWSPRGELILFDLDFFKAANIYQYDLRNNRLETLASEGYNEHAHYFATGKKILWMSSAGNRNRGTDYWRMNADGSDKRRITDLNNPANPGFGRKMIIAADASFSPDGSRLVAFLQNGLSYTGALVLIEFDNVY
ncbi:MAG: hypothetical protein WBG37_20150 [Desulfobacterales bacterium]